MMEQHRMIPVYPDRESKSLEFKSTLPSFYILTKTCVAFANGTGGKIIIGIDDKSRQIIGIDDNLRNRLYDEFPNSIYDATSPSLLVEIYGQSFGKVSIMIIEIPSSIKKPVFIKSEGLPRGVYLRAGSSTRKANAEYIEELMRENKRIYFDEESVHADIGILSGTLIKNIFGKIDLKRLVSEKIISPLPTNPKKNHPTIAGTLALCDVPHLYIPEAVVHCTRFHGVEGREIIQTEEIQGCLEKQIGNSFELVKSWLMRDYKLTGTKLQGKLFIPEVALREVIVNALLHRKYWVPGAVKIALYDNRLEVFSPGNFPGLVSLDNLGDGTTYLRNPHLVRLARRFGIIEKLGTGIKLILDSCRDAGLKKPEFMENADSVKVVFSFLPAEEKFHQDDEKLLALFAMRNEIKLRDVEQYLNVSRNTATRKLNQLIIKRKIKREGKGPAVKYVLTFQNA